MLSVPFACSATVAMISSAIRNSCTISYPKTSLRSNIFTFMSRRSAHSRCRTSDRIAESRRRHPGSVSWTVVDAWFSVSTRDRYYSVYEKRVRDSRSSTSMGTSPGKLRSNTAATTTPSNSLADLDSLLSQWRCVSLGKTGLPSYGRELGLYLAEGLLMPGPWGVCSENGDLC